MATQFAPTNFTTQQLQQLSEMITVELARRTAKDTKVTAPKPDILDEMAFQLFRIKMTDKAHKDLSYDDHIATDEEVEQFIKDLWFIKTDTEKAEFKTEVLASPTLEIETTTKQNETSKRGKRGPKKQRDPSAPKRPKNAFMLFSDTRRQEVRSTLTQASADGKVTVGEVAKVLGEEWKALSDAEKQPFLEQYEHAKTAYTEEMATHTPSTEKQDKAKVSKKFQPDTVGEDQFAQNVPEGWNPVATGYLSGRVQDENGKILKFKTFTEAFEAAQKYECGGITRTKTTYCLRKRHTLVTKHDTGEVSWAKVKTSGDASSTSGSDSE